TRTVRTIEQEVVSMSLRAWRRWGFVFLAAWLALPAMMAEASAAPASSRTKSSLSSRTTSHGTARRRTTRRRARRLPPGGVVWARHAIVLDPATDEVLFEKNSATSAPCASLTKLMTTMVFLDQKPDLDRVVEVTNTE